MSACRRVPDPDRAVDLDSAAEELYGVPAEEFGQHRTRLAAEAKAAGDKALAASIGMLRKPVLAAALVNELVRAEPPELRELTELGEQMRSAHRQLRGPELRTLSEQRQQLLHRLTEEVRAAAEQAGRSVTEPVLMQVRATFDSAIADEGAEAAVLSGRLTTVLSYTGFGEVDVSDAVAAPVRRRHLRSVPALADGPDEQADGDGAAEEATRVAEQARQRRLQRRQDELRRTEAEHAKAVEALEHSERDVQLADQWQDETSARVEQLIAALTAAQELARQAGQASRSAERARRGAEQEVDQAAAAVQAARDQLD